MKNGKTGMWVWRIWRGDGWRKKKWMTIMCRACEEEEEEEEVKAVCLRGRLMFRHEPLPMCQRSMMNGCTWHWCAINIMPHSTILHATKTIQTPMICSGSCYLRPHRPQRLNEMRNKELAVLWITVDHLMCYCRMSHVPKPRWAEQNVPWLCSDCPSVMLSHNQYVWYILIKTACSRIFMSFTLQ